MQHQEREDPVEFGVAERQSAGVADLEGNTRIRIAVGGVFDVRPRIIYPANRFQIRLL